MAPDPSKLHALVVHFPIALMMLGVPLLIALAVFKAESKSLRWVGAVVYAVASLGVLGAIYTGDSAATHASAIADNLPNGLPPEAYDVVDQHERWAKPLWVLALATAVCVGLTALSKPWRRWSAMGLALLLGLIGAGWTAYTAKLGGDLVYEHGMGIPSKLYIRQLPEIPDWYVSEEEAESPAE
jgi:uncharacterized membrane protein